MLDRTPWFFGQKFEIQSTKYDTMTKIGTYSRCIKKIFDPPNFLLDTADFF